ncbi:MAG: hypothetical protein Q4B94_05075 [Pseudomonadota bacterium]|nr:hypothetical protein [Pseudomonadota bacterium]
MKKSLRHPAIIAAAILSLISSQVLANSNQAAAHNEKNGSIEDQIKSESKGASRARFGIYGSAGYQGSSGSSFGAPRINGFLLDGGAYMMVNPIRNFADIEIGISGKYNTGSEIKDRNYRNPRHYNGLAQASIYAGPVFQISGGKHAIGFGLSKALSISEVKGDNRDKTPKNKLSNGLGAYLEYQWQGLKSKSGDSSRHLIPFTRLSVERFELTHAISKKSSEQTVIGLVVGTKY